MNSDADKLWDDLVGKLRKKQGFCPLTPEEASAAFKDAPEEDISEDFIREIVESAITRSEEGWTPDQEEEWGYEESFDSIHEGRYQIHRNEGERTPETDNKEEDLKRKMLSDDAEEDET